MRKKIVEMPIKELCNLGSNIQITGTVVKILSNKKQKIVLKFQGKDGFWLQEKLFNRDYDKVIIKNIRIIIIKHVYEPSRFEQ